MFDYIKGKIAHQREDAVVVDINGLGYLININMKTASEIPENHREVTLYLYPVFRDDNVALYGFLHLEEREMLKTLTTVSGIGTKVGLAILSFFSIDTLILNIVNEDIKALSKAPGIGKKTAERLVFELKDQFQKALDEKTMGPVETQIVTKGIVDEAVEALTSLGYAYSEANAVAKKVYREDIALEEMIKECLIRLAQ
ncbi:MAG: Holliday junction branch migration protein RuvA [Eubacteriaceae bacterium]|jgi:Holliday junction DNA helicase RuvA|nr:Holliday junction branch migration protein RuvA [Eubacteriaceae bacterium]